jgi:hypothetical protein
MERMVPLDATEMTVLLALLDPLDLLDLKVSCQEINLTY